MGGMDLETCASLSTRLNIPIEDVMYMPVGQVCVMRRGQAPKITQRYRTAEDPRYKALSEERETGAAR